MHAVRKFSCSGQGRMQLPLLSSVCLNLFYSNHRKSVLFTLSVGNRPKFTNLQETDTEKTHPSFCQKFLVCPGQNETVYNMNTFVILNIYCKHIIRYMLISAAHFKFTLLYSIVHYICLLDRVSMIPENPKPR